MPASERTPAQKAELRRRHRVSGSRGNSRPSRRRTRSSRWPSDFPPYRKYQPAKPPRPMHVIKRGESPSPASRRTRDAGVRSRFELAVHRPATPKDESARRAAWRNGRPTRGTPSPGGRSSTGSGSTTSAGGSWRRRTTSARMGARPTHPRAARLAGRHLPRRRRVDQATAPPHRHQHHLPTMLRPDRRRPDRRRPGPWRPGVRRHRLRESVPLADEPHPPRRRVRARRDPPSHGPAGPDDGRAVGEAVQVRRPQRRGVTQGRLRRLRRGPPRVPTGAASTATCSARCRTRSWTASTAPTPRSSPPGATPR